MKIWMVWALAIALLVGVPLVIEGIRTDDPGFWMFVGFVIVAAIAMHWKLNQLAKDPPSQRPLKDFGDGDE